MINPLEMMKNLENIKQTAQQFKDKTATLKATGYAMGNQIEVVVNGSFTVESIKIDPSLLSADKAPMLEVFVASAVNNAFENIKNLIEQESRDMIPGLNLGI